MGPGTENRGEGEEHKRGERGCCTRKGGPKKKKIPAEADTWLYGVNQGRKF